MRKANCDVDLTFYAMRDVEKYNQVLFLTGDGDFKILLEHLVRIKKNVIVIANSKRTAREIKLLNGIQFNNLEVLKQTIEFKQKKSW